jgi:Mannosyltransferase (PIG-V)
MRQVRAVDAARPPASDLAVAGEHPDGATERTPRRWWAWIVGAYLAIGAVLTLLATLGERNVLEPLPEGAVLDGLSPVLDVWFRYDSGWYYAIALNGYGYAPGEQSSVAFWPTYPMAIRLVDDLVGSVGLAGFLVTVVSGLGAALLFFLWCRRFLPTRNTIVAVALLLLYPYSLFLYGAVYADALFLLTALGAFLLLERGHPWLAGLVGTLATAGRPVGVVVVVGLVIRAVELRAARTAERGESLPVAPNASYRDRIGAAFLSAWAAVRTVRWTDAGVLLSALGLLAWSTYLWVSFDEPLAFAEVEGAPGWDQEPGPRTWFKIAFLGTLVLGPYSGVPRLLIPAIFVLIALLLVWRVRRRFGWGYAAYAFLAVFLPAISTKDFMGTGRYLLAAFPVLAAAGDLLATTRRRWLLPAVLIVFAVLLALGAYFYGTGYQVS